MKKFSLVSLSSNKYVNSAPYNSHEFEIQFCRLRFPATTELKELNFRASKTLKHRPALTKYIYKCFANFQCQRSNMNQRIDVARTHIN